MPSGYDMPLNRFDMVAGAKATYTEWAKRMGYVVPRWEDLTVADKDAWTKILKAGVIAAQEAKKRKVTKRLLRSFPPRRAEEIGRLVPTARQATGNPATDTGGTR